MYTASLVCGGGRLRGLAKKKIVRKLLLRSTPRKARLRDLEKIEEKKRRAYAASHAGVLLSSNLWTNFFFCTQQAFFALAQTYAASHAGVLLEVLGLLALLVQQCKY